MKLAEVIGTPPGSSRSKKQARRDTVDSLDNSMDKSRRKRAKEMQNDTANEFHGENITPPERAAKPQPLPRKIFNDPVHNSIRFEGLCLKIIDTPEFQRLRGLKQLGVCDRVFPGAVHTRFEHSLGVAHLAETLVTKIARNQPELGITETDILCVKVAGLCHDLGHGPFSHVFDGVFIKRCAPHLKWRHEDGSVMMLKHLIKKNKINITKYGMKEIDLLFVEEIIGGVPAAQRRGRQPEKFYLYDIVNNTRSGLDVDKLDYYQRDMKHANVISQVFSVERFITLGRVMPAEPISSSAPTSTKSTQSSFNGTYHNETAADLTSTSTTTTAMRGGPRGSEYMICYPEKMVPEALSIFAVRFDMHQKVYQHHAVKAVEFMLTDALAAANEHIRIPGSKTAAHPDGLYKMSECITDMTAMSILKDSVVDMIRFDPNPALDKAREILNRMDRRSLYSCVGKSSYKRGDRTGIEHLNEEQIEKEILQISQSFCGSGGFGFDEYGDTGVNNTGGNNTGGAYGSYSYATQDSYTLSQSEEILEGVVAEGEVLGGAAGCYGYDFNPNTDSYGGEYSILMSQDSVLSAMGPSDPPLKEGDIIVEKMSIHYGLKEKNPVARLRFFAKNYIEQPDSYSSDYGNQGISGLGNGAGPGAGGSSSGGGADTDAASVTQSYRNHNMPSITGRTEIAHEVQECDYEHVLPRVFEDRKVRVFCRDPCKYRSARKAFEEWCKKKNATKPFPSSPFHNLDRSEQLQLQRSGSRADRNAAETVSESNTSDPRPQSSGISGLTLFKEVMKKK